MTISETSTGEAQSTPQSRSPKKAEDLRMYDARIETISTSDASFQRISWSADGDADYVDWTICPVSLGSCQRFESVANQSILANYTPGAYEFSLRACLYQKSSSPSQESCGEQIKIKGSISKDFTLAEKSNLWEWTRMINQITDFRKRLKLLKDELDQGLKACSDHHATQIEENERSASQLRIEISALEEKLKKIIIKNPLDFHSGVVTSTEGLAKTNTTTPSLPPTRTPYNIGGLSLVVESGLGNPLAPEVSYACHIVDDLRPAFVRLKEAIGAL